MVRLVYSFFLISALLMTDPDSCIAGPITVRMGVLAGGSVSWELAAASRQAFDLRQGLTVQPLLLANPDAAKIALQGGSVDVIVTDWIWVAKQREQGRLFSFIPYSSHQGVLLVPDASSIHSIRDLVGKKLGIVGGGMDKNWLLLQALAQQQAKLDLGSQLEKIFGAAPLLQQQLESGRIDALLTQWHFAARIEGQGYRRLLGGDDLLRQQSINPQLASLGLVFSETWARSNPGLPESLHRVFRETNQALCEKDAVWQGIADVVSDSELMRKRLREGYCTGRGTLEGETQAMEASKLYTLLFAIAGGSVTTPDGRIPAGTFWPE